MFLDLVQRMDPRIGASGDRFCRQIRLHGQLLAELQVADRTPRVRVVGDGDYPLDSQDDCLAVVDRLVRQLLSAAAEPAAEPEAQAGPGPATPRLAPGRLASDAGPDADSPEGLDEGRFSLEPIRQSVASAKVSRREYSALENPVEEP
jgi:hypothetical protein